MPHKDVNPVPRVQSWKEALADAKAQLEAAKRRVRELRSAIRVCEDRVRTKEPFPGFSGQQRR